MTRPVAAVAASMPLDELEAFLVSEGVSGAPVFADSGEIVGIVSKTDVVHIIRIQQSGTLKDLLIPRIRAADIMSAKVFCVPPDATARQVADIMVDEYIHRVLVGTLDNVEGIISSHDMLDLIR